MAIRLLVVVDMAVPEALDLIRDIRNPPRGAAVIAFAVNEVTADIIRCAEGHADRSGAEVVIPNGGASGVLAPIGGWALLLQDSKPQFVYAFSNQPEHKYRIASAQPLTAGNHAVRFGFKYDGGGIGKAAIGTLFVDGKVAQAPIPRTIPIRFSLDETFDIGEDLGTPVVEDYAAKMPFAFTGTLKKVIVVLEPDKLTAEERTRLLAEEARASLAIH